AAEGAERLGGEIAAVRARIAELDAAALEERLTEIEERRSASELQRRRIDGQLEALLAERQLAEDELADAAGRRETSTAELYRLRSAVERAELRRESASELAARFEAELDEARGAADAGLPSRVDLERKGDAATAEARAAARHADECAATARLAGERLVVLERALAEREGLPPASRALSEEGAPMLLSL